VDKSTKASVSTSATRTAARVAFMIENIATIILLVGIGVVITVGAFVCVLMASYKE
jgi:hypothetical protein